MLNLSRKKNQRIRIRIGDHVVWLQVTDVRGSAVQLGIDAGPEVEIVREECIRKADAA